MIRVPTLDPTGVEISELQQFRDEWFRLPDDVARTAVAHEEQYLRLHLATLERLRDIETDQTGSGRPLGLSVRAGAIKAFALLTSSIAEVALRSHAMARGIALPDDAQRRTYGGAGLAWKNDNLNFGAIAAIWPKLVYLRTTCHEIHLYNGINGDEDHTWFHREEPHLVESCLDIIAHLKRLES